MDSQQSNTPTIAVASFVLGIASALLLGLITGIPAVILGHRSLSMIKREPHLSGRGMAIIDTFTGYIGIAWSLVLLALMIVMLVGSQSAEPVIFELH